MNPELIKLLGILGGGILTFIIGFYIMKKKKDNALDNMVNYQKGSSQGANYSPHLSEREEKGKNYITQYKDTYPRDALKAALVKAGNYESDVDDWLNKYL